MPWFKPKVQWQTIESLDYFDDLRKSPAFYIFKHSTRCSISSMAKARLEAINDLSHPIYYLDLISFRDISNQIAEVLNVEHQSPQLILVKDGVAVGYLTHNAISATNIKDLENTI